MPILVSEEKRFMLNSILLHTILGGGVGIVVGGAGLLYKGATLNRLPLIAFRSCAAFATLSGVEGCLELARGLRDDSNNFIAGAWTGFVFGHGGTGNWRIGLVAALNAAIFNTILKSSRVKDLSKLMAFIPDNLDPLAADGRFASASDRVSMLRAEIAEIKQKRN